MDFQQRLALIAVLRAVLVSSLVAASGPAFAMSGALKVEESGGGGAPPLAASANFLLPDGAVGTGVGCLTFASCFS